MKLVVDTNILFSFFWKNSFTKHLLVKPEFNLFSPEFALVEIKKYSKYIMKRANIDEKEFKKALSALKSIINFVHYKDYECTLKSTEEIAPDIDDSHFLALSLKLSCPIWSNDKKLKEQEKIKVLSTEDIIDLLF